MRRTFAIISILLIAMATAAPGADVTVSKPGGGGTYATVQAGLTAAGANGSVTILDSETYVEDVTVEIAQANVTIQAASGQRPTIQAANTRHHASYNALGFTAPDRFGLSVQAPCVLIGLNIENPDPTVNMHGLFGEVTACALAVHSPNVTVRNCTLFGPTAGLGPGDWATCLLVAFSPTPASMLLENCELYGGEYAAVNETFQVANPALADSYLVLTNCMIHDAASAGLTTDAGGTTATGCVIYSNAVGVSGGGGRTVLIGCDIRDNGEEGLGLDWNDSFAHVGDNPRALADDCVFLRNGVGDPNILVDDGSLTIQNSIISQGGGGGIRMRNDSPAPGYCNVNFCDIFQPLGRCVGFEGPDVQTGHVGIRNSILAGDECVINVLPHTATVSYSDAWARVTAFQDTATSNNVTIDPVYLGPFGGSRDGFRYYNTNLNVGEGGVNIGSQGQYIPSKPLRARSWFRYE